VASIGSAVDFAQKLKSTIPTLEHIIAARAKDHSSGIHSLDALIEAEEACDSRALVDSIEHDSCQVVLLQLSGGTSGIPKLIPRFNNEYRYAIQSVVDWLGFDQSIVSFTPNPLMHNAPMACYWGPALMLGGEVAIADGPSLTDIESTLAARKPTWHDGRFALPRETGRFASGDCHDGGSPHFALRHAAHCRA
jgi:non-ribosomal peptide synthetase component E (peptide arylation enzyme)